MPTPSSSRTASQDHSLQQQPQQRSYQTTLAPGSLPSCPEDHPPLAGTHSSLLPTPAAMNVEGSPDSTTASPSSPRSSTQEAYPYDHDSSPERARNDEEDERADRVDPRSPSYAPTSPSRNAINARYAGFFDSSASRSTTMSPRPHSRVHSAGSVSGESNTATSPTPDDEEEDDDEDDFKPMDLEEEPPVSSGVSQLAHIMDTEDEMPSPMVKDGKAIIDTDWNDYEYCSPALTHGFMARRVVPISPSTYLRPGSRFKGTQTSERSVYNVDVEIKHVDLRESFLCGYLHIEGLTPDNPSICTYFEGEIIGPKYGFLTKHECWGADERIDFSHWSKFAAFRSYAKSLKKGVVKEVDFSQEKNIFMRWKEHFLVPDHRKSSIPGASFEGFYYICFNQVSGEVTGIYFHAKSEKFQQLDLQHVQNNWRFSSVEFR